MRKQYYALIGVAVALLLLGGCGEERIALEEEIEVNILFEPQFDYCDVWRGWGGEEIETCYFTSILYEGWLINTSEYFAPARRRKCCLRFCRNLYHELKKVAQKQCKSMSLFINEALEQAIKEGERDEN